VPPFAAIEEIEENLNEPLPDEVSADVLERRRRRKIAEENRAATERLAGVMGLERDPRRA
jgi:outer membrane protein TolC